jgi:hypothetical protein
MLVVLTVTGLVGLLVDRVARGGPSRRGASASLPEPAAPALPRVDPAAESPAPPTAASPAAGLSLADPVSAGPSLADPVSAGPSLVDTAPPEVVNQPVAQPVHPGPYPGSALPLADGSAPSTEYVIKANAATRRSHGPDSPYYARTRAQVWFRGVEDAESAGFRHWSRKK